MGHCFSKLCEASSGKSGELGCKSLGKTPTKQEWFKKFLTGLSSRIGHTRKKKLAVVSGTGCEDRESD